MRSRGFTLLEVLIAMAIFAMIAVAATAMFSQMQDSEVISREQGAELHQLQRAMAAMERDFMQIVSRQVRLNEEAPVNQSLRASAGFLDSDAMGIAFIRTGWRNPQARLPRSELQGVGYRLREEKLERLATLYPDPSSQSEPRAVVLLAGVEDLTFKFFHNGRWQEQWQGDGLPQAVQVTLKTKRFGTIVRAFLLPAAVTTSSQAAGGTT